MPPEFPEPDAPNNASSTVEVVQLLEQALDLLDTIPDTAHLAAQVQGIVDELKSQDVGSEPN